MRFKHWKIFFIFLFLSIECFGQSGLLMSVSGKVLDINTNLPVKNFEVTLFRIENGNIVDVEFGKTDERGIYKIRYLKAGDYKYLIEIPNVGIVYIGGENDDGSSYRFTLKEGRNLNLNFFIGTSKIFDVKKEMKYNKIINVTFLYGEESTEVETQILRSSSGCQLIIEDEPNEPIEVGDNEDLGTGRNGKPAGGKYLYEIKIERAPFKCKNGKCRIDWFKPKLETSIQIHSEKWFQDNYGKNYKDGLGGCLKGSMIEHEKKHWEDASQFAESNFCKIMEAINNVSAKCNCPPTASENYINKCSKEIKSLIEVLNEILQQYLIEISEDNAYEISIPCDRECYNKYK